MNTDLFSAFVIGLLGSGHCIGMCGGITTMLTAALPQANPTEKGKINHQNTKRFMLVLLYHLGRISSYGIIGGIVGFTGSIAAKNLGLPLLGLRMIAAIFLILLGLYLGRWLMVLNKVEQFGKHLWKFISPLSKKLIPVQSPMQALGLGALWGWLPCGLVYSTLTWSLASSSLTSGALIMVFFGLGTLPALLSISFGLLSIKSLFVNPFFRKSMALLIIVYGLYSLMIATRLMFIYY